MWDSIEATQARSKQSGDLMRLVFGLSTALLVSAAAMGSALAQSAECARLQQAIAASGHGNGQSGQYEAAAQKQRGEIDRTVAYAQQIGCENHKFLFFGNNPPPQCDQINAQISRMQANLAALQARAGGGEGGRAELVARYNAQCANPAPQQPHGIFDALFGNPREPQQSEIQTTPLNPDANPNPDQPPPDGEIHEARAGSKAVCVRSCDGSFFPVSYSAGSSRLDELQDMCRALCPNADVTLYTYSPAADIETAVSITGARYMDSPTALKYRKSIDNSCTCKRRGQSWADALAGAEQRLGGLGRTDIMVTPEKSAELSRPKPDPKAKPGKQPAADASKTPQASAADPKAAAAAQDQAPIDQLLGQQAATVSHESSGIAAGDATSGPLYTKGQGQTEELTGADGVKRRVRIIDPTL
jgi:hypothetical protein